MIVCVVLVTILSTSVQLENQTDSIGQLVLYAGIIEDHQLARVLLLPEKLQEV